MKVTIEFESNGFSGNKEGKKEIARIFSDLIYRLGSYWDTPLQDTDIWMDTTLVVYNKDNKRIGVFCAKTTEEKECEEG